MKKYRLLLFTLLFLFSFSSCVNSAKELISPDRSEKRNDTTDNTVVEPHNTISSNQTEDHAKTTESIITSTEGHMESTVTIKKAKLLYLGHASLRITTAEGKVVYIDPYAGDGYGPAADLILVTHAHSDHSKTELIKNRTSDCRVITWKEALKRKNHQIFDLGYITVESVEAGYNRNHDVKDCVGYILTLSDGVSVYISGDTSTTEQMPLLAERHIDYAFYCCDGIYNMDIDEASECARLVNAKHDIPYHLVPPNVGLFDRERAERFDSTRLLIIVPGEEIDLV